jgi:NADH dehydrogenase
VTDESPPDVVIIGGGFAGLYAAKALADAPVRVTVLDRRNHHLFQPMLYQVATAALNPADIASPIRSVLRHQQNTEVLLAEAESVDVERRAVHLEDGASLSYDYLLIGTGARHSYFGHDEWEVLAPGLKSLEDALEIRRRVLLAFERAEREPDPVRRHAYLTFVVVGGGPTGVEMAGAVAEIRSYALKRDFRHIDPAEATVMLLEGAPRLLTSYPPKLSDEASASLSLGVEVAPRRAATEIIRLVSRRWTIRPGRSSAAATSRAAAQVAGAPLDGPARHRARLHHPRHRGLVLGDAAAQPPGRHPAGHLPGGVRWASTPQVVAGDLRSQPRQAFRCWDEDSSR